MGWVWCRVQCTRYTAGGVGLVYPRRYRKSAIPLYTHALNIACVLQIKFVKHCQEQIARVENSDSDIDTNTNAVLSRDASHPDASHCDANHPDETRDDTRDARQKETELEDKTAGADTPGHVLCEDNSSKNILVIGAKTLLEDVNTSQYPNYYRDQARLGSLREHFNTVFTIAPMTGCDPALHINAKANRRGVNKTVEIIRQGGTSSLLDYILVDYCQNPLYLWSHVLAGATKTPETCGLDLSM